MRSPSRDVRPTLRCALAAAACVALAPHPALAAPRPFAPAPWAGPFADAIVFMPLPGLPFQAVPSAGGRWLYVSLINPDLASLDGIGVLRREGHRVSVLRVVPTDPQPTGMALTHDGALLVVANGNRVLFLDTARMQSGEGNALLGAISDATGAGSVYANITRDDGLLFVSDEFARTITVINLARARSEGFKPDAIVGKIPVGRGPIALTFSSDERFLYTTSQVAAPNWGWSAVCFPEGITPPPAAPTDPEGAVIVVDVERAKRDPSNAVVARVPAGCHPVRLALSRDGDVAFVTARGSDALLAFAADRLVADSTQAPFASVPVGPAPVGVAVGLARGREVVVVANSNRFASAGAETLSVIDAARVAAGASAVIGHIPAGEFPRELRVLDDGHTLVVTNFLSQSLEFVDLEHLSLPWGPAIHDRLGDVSGAVGSAVPTQFALEQNRPNPFSGKTTIRFALPIPASVRLEIFDAQGRRVQTVARGRYEAGYHSIEWDRSDSGGNPVKPGIYLYRLIAGSFQSQKEMVLLP